MKRVLEIINGFVLVFMLGITVTTVVFRVILQIPASWSEELASYSFIALVFIGAAALCRDDGHITITVLTDRLGLIAQKVIRIAGRAVTIAFLVPFTIGAFMNMRSNWTVSLPTVRWMHIGYIYLILFISGVIMIYYLVVNSIIDLMPKKDSAVEGDSQ